jgi:hypothetical protein
VIESLIRSANLLDVMLHDQASAQYSDIGRHAPTVDAVIAAAEQ